MINMCIETPNLIIRKFSPKDAKDISHYSQQPSVAYWMSDMIFHTEESALSWISWINNQINTLDPFVVLAIEHKCDGICIGIVGVHPKAEIDNEIEILYGISDNYQNRGYATEASQSLIQWSFENTKLRSLTAIVKPNNIPSKAIIEKLGFKYVDTKAVLYDGDFCNFNYYKLYNN